MLAVCPGRSHTSRVTRGRARGPRLRIAALTGAAIVACGVGSAAFAASTPIGVANVAKLKQSWKAAAGMGGGFVFQSPVVANGFVYVGQSYGRVMVYSAKSPDAYCGFSPRQCQPAWIGLAGGGINRTPVVTGGQGDGAAAGGGGGAPA